MCARHALWPRRFEAAVIEDRRWSMRVRLDAGAAHARGKTMAAAPGLAPELYLVGGRRVEVCVRDEPSLR